MSDLIMHRALFWLAGVCVGFVMISTCLWLCLLLWFHQPLGEFLSFVSIACICLTALIALAFFGARLPYRKPMLVYWLAFVCGVGYFFSLTPQNNRQWQGDVARVFDFSQNGQEITVHQVRNFAWHSEQKFDVNWASRSYRLDKLERADLIISDWGLGEIVHTMVSFGFSDGQYLTFSIETRKESSEQYSALAGFFRKYELLFVAGDEKDLIYTRSNVRGEQVYLYPITASQEHLQNLFLAYLNTGQSLKDKPQWYNTLFSNCTTVIYQLIDTIAPNALPKDYRLLLAGRLPSYLYEHHLLDNRHSPKQWQTIAHINPKTHSLNLATPSTTFSQVIRQGVE